MPRRATAYTTPARIETQAEGWLASLRAGARTRPGLVLDPARCALLVIDMVRYFAGPEGRRTLPAAPAAVQQAARLLEAFRAGGGQVIFTRHGHRGPEDLGMLGRFFTDHLRRDEADSEIVPALSPREGEAVLWKTTYDAFLDTGLTELLRARGLDQVLIAGVQTHLCCETTARSAFCRGFEVYLPVDALAASTEALHLGSLRGLAAGVAVLTSTREVVSSWPA